MVGTINRVYTNPKIKQCVGCVSDVKGSGIRGNVGIRDRLVVLQSAIARTVNSSSLKCIEIKDD
jgi:hypothetical protein